MSKDIALIVGVGQATGQSLCRMLAGKYTLVLIARSKEFITSLANELPDTHAYTCDVADRVNYEATLKKIVSEVGLPKRILVNTEKAAWGDYNHLDLDELSVSFDVNAISLLQLVQVLFPTPEAIQEDTRIVVSSSPGAYTPPPQFLGMAPSRFAQRIIAELLDENLADQGLRFSVYSIDGAIDEPKMRNMMPDQPDSFFIPPDEVAKGIVECFETDDFQMITGVTGESSFAKR